jgi:pimeloyl-ACP methyl ester carboxylesterase
MPEVWHGEDDRNVPVINGVRQADAIPHATLHRLAHHSHWLTYDHFTEMLAQIMSRS